MEAPCQKIVWDVLPAIRAAIAVELVRCGVSQVEAARMLEIAPSAVSQYLSGKRGYRIEFENDVKKSIELLAADLKDGQGHRTSSSAPATSAASCGKGTRTSAEAPRFPGTVRFISDTR